MAKNTGDLALSLALAALDDSELKSLEERVDELARIGFKPLIVEELPTEGMDSHTLYLVPNTGEQENDYDEYLWFEDTGWELMGTTSVDLSNYATKDELLVIGEFNFSNINSMTSDTGRTDTLSQSNIAKLDSWLKDIVAKGKYNSHAILIYVANGNGYLFTQVYNNGTSAGSLSYSSLGWSGVSSVFGKNQDNYLTKATLNLNITWENGVPTVTGGNIQKGQVRILDRENTRAYTPTTDYQPTTKKYVDDEIEANKLNSVYISNSNRTDANIITALDNAYQDYLLQKPYSIFIECSPNNGYNTYIEANFTRNSISTPFTTISLNTAKGTDFFYGRATFTVTNNHITAIGRIDTYQAWLSDLVTYGPSPVIILTTKVNQNYNVDKSYTPAHKTYVDEASIDNANGIVPYSNSQTYQVGDLVRYYNADLNIDMIATPNKEVPSGQSIYPTNTEYWSEVLLTQKEKTLASQDYVDDQIAANALENIWDGTGNGAIAGGLSGTATGIGSIGIGANANATGDYAVAIGSSASASGDWAKSIGYMTKASSAHQTVIGRNNIEDTNTQYALIVGNGASVVGFPGSNAHTLDWNGNAWYEGVVKVGGNSYTDANELATQQYVDNKAFEGTENDWEALTPVQQAAFEVAVVETNAELTPTDVVNLNAITGEDEPVVSDMTEEEAIAATDEIIGGGE